MKERSDHKFGFHPTGRASRRAGFGTRASRCPEASPRTRRGVTIASRFPLINMQMARPSARRPRRARFSVSARRRASCLSPLLAFPSETRASAAPSIVAQERIVGPSRIALHRGRSIRRRVARPFDASTLAARTLSLVIRISRRIRSSGLPRLLVCKGTPGPPKTRLKNVAFDGRADGAKSLRNPLPYIRPRPINGQC